MRARVASIARAVDPACRAFLYTPVAQTPPRAQDHTDAMWAALERGVPTVNGRSGSQPPGWNLWDVVINDGDDVQRITGALTEWIEMNDSSLHGVCWVKTS